MGQPNVVIVLTDQLRRQALSCYGDTNIRTTHIDQLAGAGARCANACSTYPICVPFRFSLMTGHYGHARQVPGIEWRMSTAERTLADEFNDAGYQTIYVGKWHLDGGHGRQGFHNARTCNLQRVPRSRQGRWKKWLGFELRNGPFDTHYFEDDDPTPRKIEGYQTDGLFDLAMNEMRSSSEAGKPFCCVISVEPPHPPFEAPQELTDKWTATELDLPPNFMTARHYGSKSNKGWHAAADDARERVLRERQIYYAMVENLDNNVGRLARFLDDNSLTQDTIVVFMADHGEMSGAYGLTGKQFPFEESSGIPLIVRGPGIAAGHVVSTPSNTEDLFPTLLGLAHLPARGDVPGSDLSPLMRAEHGDIDRPGVLLEFVNEMRSAAVFYDEVWRGFRSQRYLYAVLGNGTGMKPWIFFDLKEDPYCLHNLVADANAQPLVAQHHRWMIDAMIATEDDNAPVAAAFGEPMLCPRDL